MDVKERAHDFCFTFEDDDGHDKPVSIALTGVNPELGQTLASTGLTVWRAAQEMARFMWENRRALTLRPVRWFAGKRVLELGAGLGLCGVLASKLCIGGTVAITDGGEEFTDSAMEALRRNLEKNSCDLVEPRPRRRRRQQLSQEEEKVHAVSESGDGGGGGRGAKVLLERLTWGEHADFLERNGGAGDGGDDGGCGGGGGGGDNDSAVVDGEGQEGGYGGVGCTGGGFDFIVAADVIYEEAAVSPLLHTVVDILMLRRAKDSFQQEQQQQQQQQPPPLQTTSSCPPPPPPSVSTFLLAFARRNISIDRVLDEADGLGLRWRVPENFTPTSSSENIYLMCLA
ncbi:unnamed protein product [Laminaria digitata]